MAGARRPRTTAKALRTALLENGEMVRALFEWELEEHVESYVQSKRDDGDEYLFAVTEHSGDVAMVLVDKDDTVHINEAARKRLRELWPDPAYRSNLEYFIPQMVQELNAGRIFNAGLKVAAGPVAAPNMP